jgi:hypothetical protein
MSGFPARVGEVGHGFIPFLQAHEIGRSDVGGYSHIDVVGIDFRLAVLLGVLFWGLRRTAADECQCGQSEYADKIVFHTHDCISVINCKSVA